MIEAGGGAIAKVNVDVPLMQTDKPYSYQIPLEFEDNGGRQVCEFMSLW